MSNSFYNHGAFPSTGSAATSASMRAELDLVAAGFDKMPTLAGNANKFIVVNSTGTGLTQTDVLPAFTVTDTDFTVQDDGDNTRKFKFNAGSITTGNTRVYVMPDLDTTLVGTNVTQTLTNKTLTAPVIATIVNTGTLTLPTSTDTLIGRDTTDTLTNKTLTNPVIGTIVNTGTLTLPTSTDTLVGRQTTDTLTNKTISGASNTLSNIANGSLSNSSVVIGSSTLSLGGTLTTLAGVTISGASNTLSNIANASLTNSSITINGSTVALGSSVTVTATATNALTIGNGLSGTSYNGSSAVTIAINTGVTADLSTAQTFSNKTISGSANTLTNIANASLTNSAITIGSTAISLGATSLTLAGLTSASATTLISTGNQATSVAISAIGHSSGTVTVTTSTAHGLTTGDVASIDGVADYTFCGVYTVAVSNANVFTYSQTASGASSSGGFSTKLSGTWGLYAGGTGPSLANGPVMINASSQLPALRVTQGGSGYALIVEDAANPDTSAFIISNAGDLAINTNKFTVAAASGNTVIAGTTSLNGNVTFATDATYDIGASGATRPRDLFLSRNLVVGGTLTLAGGVNLNGNVTIGDASADTLTINSTITSNLIFTDNTYDIGASGATRPRTGYFGTSVITPLIDATNLEVTNIKALDGTAAITIANTTGAVAVSTNLTIGNATSDTLTVTSTITSNLIFTDNTYDIGASGATRPRNLYLSGLLNVSSTATLGGAVTLGTTAGNAITFNGTITSNLIFTDNTYDIGASGATRPRNLFLAGAIVVGTSDANATVTAGGANTNLTLSSVGAGGILSLNSTYGRVGAVNPDGSFRVTGNGVFDVYKTTGTANINATADAGAASLVATTNVNTSYAAVRFVNSTSRTYEIGTGGSSAGYTDTRSKLYIQDVSAGSGVFRMTMNSAGAFAFNTAYTGPNSSSDINVSTYLSIGTADTQYWQMGKASTTIRANIKGNAGIGSSFLNYFYDNNATTASNEVAYIDVGLVALDEGQYGLYTKYQSTWYTGQIVRRGATGFGVSPDVTSRIHVSGRPIYVDNNNAPALTMNSSGTTYGLVGNSGADQWALGYTTAIASSSGYSLLWNKGLQVSFNGESPDATTSTNSAKFIPITGSDAIKLVSSGSTLVATRGTTYYFAPRSLADNAVVKILDGTYTYMTFELIVSYGGGSAMSGMGSYLVDIVNSSIQVVTNGELNSNIVVVAASGSYPPSPTSGKLTISCQGSSSNSWIAVANGTGGTVTNVDIYIRMLNTR